MGLLEEFEQMINRTDYILIDELELALKQVVNNYEDRHSRKPTILELIDYLETVIRSNPTHYISDPKDLKFREIFVLRKRRRSKRFE
jgi:hypothetical protein